MRRSMMKSKIHRATVTGAHLHYMGSITIDRALCEAVDLLPQERVHVLNLDNGARVETYVIPGKRRSGQVRINGAAARFFSKHDRIIIIAYAEVEDKELKGFKSRVAFVDKHNRLLKIREAAVRQHRLSLSASKGKTA
ncbi:aspartate 1-decarboxylase [candidate division FCPU426 bacterium]|nr:aspartate 1-decarboxylase [candidate division FCPU426 bacterium]